MILEQFDPNREAVINPWQLREPLPDFPEVTVACFSDRLFNAVLQRFDPQELLTIHCASADTTVYRIEYDGCSVAFYRAPVGEPVCIMVYEELLAAGSNRLVLFGTCGTLDRNIKDCGIVIPTKAIRDEGCSYHYAPPSDMIDVNHKHTDVFKQLLEEIGYTYTEGITWTTDASYRETREKVQLRKELGAVCVEMECAGMQALCDFRNTDFFQFFYAADNLDGAQWDKRSLGCGVKLDEKIQVALLAFELAKRIVEDSKHT